MDTRYNVLCNSWLLPRVVQGEICAETDIPWYPICDTHCI
jgi:hypothetical protein